LVSANRLDKDSAVDLKQPLSQPLEIYDRHVFSKSKCYRAHAVNHLAYGVSSTPRASQLPFPVVIDRAEGVNIADVDGNTFLDYCLGYGPLLLGHTPKPVLEAVQNELAKGLRTASIHRGEARLADLIAELVPSGAQSAFVSSGSEAIQLALRVARAATGRNRIAKFRANYHGWFDNLHIANSIGNDGAATIGQDPEASHSVELFDWGSTQGLEEQLDSSFAAVIVEPAAINAGCFAPPEGFLQALRDITRRLGIVLIFDEVITGFRLALGGAQQRYGVTPDLSVLGKALGAGLPIGAVSGQREVMEVIASGRLLHRGTFNGNPVSLGAGIACLETLKAEQATLYPRLDRIGGAIAAHVNAEAKAHDAPIFAQNVGGCVQLFAGVTQMDGMADLPKIDRSLILCLTSKLLQQGIYTLPRGLMYVSSVHSEDDLAFTRQAVSTAVMQFAQGLDANR
jgi:glutamate-1-semialdehyde 2,1-aminomutase